MSIENDPAFTQLWLKISDQVLNETSAVMKELGEIITEYGKKRYEQGWDECSAQRYGWDEK